MIKQGQKFSTELITIKANIKAERIKQGHPMKEFAECIGVTRKTLEDIETPRNYGSFIGIEVLIQYMDALGMTLEEARGLDG